MRAVSMAGDRPRGNVDADLPVDRPLRIVYELGVNDWQGRQALRLLVRHVETWRRAGVSVRRQPA